MTFFCIYIKNIKILILGDFMNINWTEALSIIPRSFLSFIILFIVTKLIGKKQVSELSLFDYVVGISIGNFASEMTMNLDGQYINGVIAVIIYGIIAYLVAVLTMKSMFLRRVIIGTPTIIIQEGKILEKNMRKVKIDINDLLEQCRTAGYFNINDINYAIMEANGKLSIMPKGEQKPLTPKDMKIKTTKEGLCANIIIDGNVMMNNLENMNKTEEWLEKELRVKGYKDINNILLATLDVNEKITIYEKNLNMDDLNVLE